MRPLMFLWYSGM